MSDGSSTHKDANAWRGKFRSRSHDAAHDQQDPAPAVRCDHPLVFTGQPQLIDDQTQLLELIARLRQVGSFAFDSEFIGELYYVPKLCLIQIGTPQEIALIDPLAPLDLMPLWELLCDPSVEKIVHAGGQDVEPAQRATGKPAANVIDTQIAAGFAHLPYPLSLQRLILQMLDVRISKGLTFTHWDQRPLSPQQIHYAADDVRYLPAVWSELRKLVQASGAQDWIRQECDTMCRVTSYQFDPQTSYLRVRGASSLNPREMGILRELTIWRDVCARSADLPARSFLKDEILIDLCRRAPTTDDKLNNIQGLPRPIRQDHCERILSAIVQGRANPIADGQEVRKSDELPADQFRIDALFAMTQTMCLVKGIDPQMAFNRADVAELLRALAAGHSCDHARLMQSWRRDVVGQWLADTVQNGLTTRVGFEGGQLKIADSGNAPDA